MKIKRNLSFSFLFLSLFLSFSLFVTLPLLLFLFFSLSLWSVISFSFLFLSLFLSFSLFVSVFLFLSLPLLLFLSFSLSLRGAWPHRGGFMGISVDPARFRAGQVPVWHVPCDMAHGHIFPTKGSKCSDPLARPKLSSATWVPYSMWHRIWHPMWPYWWLTTLEIPQKVPSCDRG